MKKSILIFLLMLLSVSVFAQIRFTKETYTTKNPEHLGEITVFRVSKIVEFTVLAIGSKIKLSDGKIIERCQVLGNIPEIGSKLILVDPTSQTYVFVEEEIGDGWSEKELIDYGVGNNYRNDAQLSFERTEKSLSFNYVGLFELVDKTQKVLSSGIIEYPVFGGYSIDYMDIPSTVIIEDSFL